MNSWQEKYLKYHNKNIFNNKLDEGALVYKHIPKKSVEKLSLTRSILYEVILFYNRQMTKWMTGDTVEV